MTRQSTDLFGARRNLRSEHSVSHAEARTRVVREESRYKTISQDIVFLLFPSPAALEIFSSSIEIPLILLFLASERLATMHLHLLFAVTSLLPMAFAAPSLDHTLSKRTEPYCPPRPVSEKCQ